MSLAHQQVATNQYQTTAMTEKTIRRNNQVPRFRSAAELRGPAMNADAKRSNATASSHARTARSTAMVRLFPHPTYLTLDPLKPDRTGKSLTALILSLFFSLSAECTYDKPSNRRRNPAPQYIEALENRLQRAESLLRNYMPDLDLTDSTLDPVIQQEFRTRALARKQAAKNRSQYSDEALEDTALASMVESVGALDLDDHGGWDFYGSSSGAMFLRQMKEHFHGMLGPSVNVPFLPKFERPNGLANLDSAQNTGASGSGPGSISFSPVSLPPKELARGLCYYSLNCATCLIRILHVPSFYELFDQLYEKPVVPMSTEERHGLALLHSVLSLGYMYRNLDPASGVKSGYRDAINEGYETFCC